MRPDPIPALKAELAREIARMVKGARTWDMAVLVRTHRSELSRIRNERLERISMERLIRVLARLGRRVELRIGPEHLAPAGAARVRGTTQGCGNPASGVPCTD